MKEQILALRAQGKSFNEIQKELGCSKSTISFHCSAGQKEKNVHRTNILRRKYKAELVALKGGKCEKCGYDRYMGALEFHHLDPSKKDFSIGDYKNSHLEKMKKEVEKCILVCANCHREIHNQI